MSDPVAAAGAAEVPACRFPFAFSCRECRTKVYGSKSQGTTITYEGRKHGPFCDKCMKTGFDLKVKK